MKNRKRRKPSIKLFDDKDIPSHPSAKGEKMESASKKSETSMSHSSQEMDEMSKSVDSEHTSGVPKIMTIDISLNDMGYDERLGVWYDEWEKECDWNMIEGDKYPKVTCVLDFGNFVINKIRLDSIPLSEVEKLREKIHAIVCNRLCGNPNIQEVCEYRNCFISDVIEKEFDSILQGRDRK